MSTLPVMLGRLVHRADFERLLASRPLSRSAHFTLHRVDVPVVELRQPSVQVDPAELYTGGSPIVAESVDNSDRTIRFGVVAPKRHARRAVTRNLVKRLGREAMREHADRLPPGLWLLRLRAGFAAGQFVSARSVALAQTLRGELQRLMMSAVARLSSAAARGAAA